MTDEPKQSKADQIPTAGWYVDESYMCCNVYGGCNW